MAGASARVRWWHGPRTQARRTFGHSFLGLEGLAPLLLELLLVPDEGYQLLGLFPHVDALVTAVPVRELEVPEGLDGENVLPALLGNALRAVLDQVVQQGEGFVDVTPVFPVVIEPLPYHAHDLCEGHHVEGEVGDFRHERARRSPGVVRSGLSYLDLGLRVVVHHVLHLPAERGGLHGGGCWW